MSDESPRFHDTAAGIPSPGLALHERGDARVDVVLRLIDEASRPRPLREVLAALCADVSIAMPAEIVSFYLRERDDEDAREVLRMAANVGFPAGAVNRVRLRVGEGVTGHVAETLRPASLRLAGEDARYKHFPGLGEENFPVFLAIPVLVGRRAEGVLVLQRRDGAFDDDEVVLATALATSFAYALERARDRRSDAEAEAARVAFLPGTSLAAGEGLGRVETLPTFEGLAALERAALGDDADDTTPALADSRRQRIAEAHESLVRDLSKVRSKLARSLHGPMQAAAAGLALLEEDGRLLESLTESASATNLPLGVRKVAREYAQALYRRGADPNAWLAGRAEEVEDFCLLLAARAVGTRVPSGSSVLLLPERLSATIVAASIAQRAAAIAVANIVDEGGLAIALARAGELPVVGDVGGLFAWARAGDVLLVEGEAGTVRVNPSPTQIARHRQREREK
jgi:phosphotransferase system enzyme I (PtsP)